MRDAVCRELVSRLNRRKFPAHKNLQGKIWDKFGQNSQILQEFCGFHVGRGAKISREFFPASQEIALARAAIFSKAGSEIFVLGHSGKIAQNSIFRKNEEKTINFVA